MDKNDTLFGASFNKSIIIKKITLGFIINESVMSGQTKNTKTKLNNKTVYYFCDTS